MSENFYNEAKNKQMYRFKGRNTNTLYSTQKAITTEN